ncbi:hemerythrin domain-containing protein [Nocardia wallacei]|uniref:hemerythrin domain-containing protein n=1 Tax=Nocardia wallacei TaxID=480035 RepID=UPI0024581E11|nr:hemerythrin domain-containing protein [Nocardia wallacei]
MYPEIESDIVGLLTTRHAQIKRLLDRIRLGTGDRRTRFDDLVRTFAAHEFSEHQVVHPAARGHGVPDDVVDQLMLQENGLEHDLAALYARGAEDPRFDMDFSDFAGAALLHCAQEEQQEYPQFLALPAEIRTELARSVLDAERLAPTRPHPSARRTPLARGVLAPALGVADRLRDAVRRRGH